MDRMRKIRHTLTDVEVELYAIGKTAGLAATAIEALVAEWRSEGLIPEDGAGVPD